MRSPRRLLPSLVAGAAVDDTPPPSDSLFWSMWNANTATADRALATAFIQGIAGGSLDPVRYGGFNVNDAYYCFNAAGDYLTASQRATDPDLQTFLAAKHQSYEHYNQAFPDLWRVSDATGVVPFPVCAEYSAFESSIAGSWDPIYALVVMIPCEYLWAWLAGKLAPPSPGNLYGPWITENNDPSGAYKLGNCLDAYMAANPGVVDPQQATSLYGQAMAYELGNFEAATQ